MIINDDNEIEAPKDMLCSKYPCIYLTQCATGEIEFLRRKIYDISDVWCTIKVAKLIVIYIYKYKVDVLLKEVHKKDDFITSDVFNFISLFKVESELQTLKVYTEILSNEWVKPPNDPHVAKFMQETNLIDYLIH